MKSKKWLSLNYFLQFAVQGVFFQYWLVYLTVTKGFTVLEASSIFAMVYIGRFVGGVVLVTSLVNKFDMKISYRILSIGGLLSALLYNFTDSNLTLSIVTLFVGATFFSLSPLTETAASIFLRKENLDYGKVRMFGSASYMLTGLIVGTILAYISKEFIYYILIALIISHVIFVFIPLPKSLEDSERDEKEPISFYWIKDDKNAILIILLFFLLQLSHAAYNNYSVLYVESLNLSVKWMLGILISLSIVAEILFFAFSNRIPLEINIKNLVTFVCSVAVFRWAILAIFPNIYIFAFTQLLHAITFALAQLSFILLLNKNFSSRKILTMQNLYSSIAFQLSAFIGMYIVGYIWEISTEMVFAVSSLIALMALILSRKLRLK
ncbi:MULTISPECIES: MFS transporter [unclassified Gemella]|uniref:MFS transporter n=1 Tax=unclassified Gemella TaxID=2624949 RepID=UPI0015D08515|nr:MULTISPECIES: MFS transporter [unclassified Gemella]MBF0710254.1 MFS transporter [Gemella sp. GL1.1]NYS27598.1 MFS transporter [Gemella sp. GL1]